MIDLFVLLIKQIQKSNKKKNEYIKYIYFAEKFTSCII